MALDAVVFDFDGVIIDSEATSFTAWSEVFARYRVELTRHAFVEAMGGHNSGMYELLASEASVPLPDEQAVRAAKHERHHELLAARDTLPGVREWIADARARGLGVAIASSSPSSWIEEHLRRLDLAEFDHVCCFDGTGLPKPAPDLYLRACALLGVAPSDALAVEDSPNGLRAARASGMWTLGVRHELTLDLDLAADIVVESLHDLSLARAQVLLGGRGPVHPDPTVRRS